MAEVVLVDAGLLECLPDLVCGQDPRTTAMPFVVLACGQLALLALGLAATTSGLSANFGAVCKICSRGKEQAPSLSRDAFAGMTRSP